MDKDKSLLNGKGEDDISWITVNGAHIPIRDGEDKAAAIKKHFEENESNVKSNHAKLTNKEWENGLLKEEKQSARDYGNYAISWNRQLWHGETPQHNSIKHLDNLINSYELKEPIIVYRNIPTANSEEKDFTSPGYVSTTIDKDKATRDASRSYCVIHEYEIPAGKGRGAYINNLVNESYKDVEYEFLLARNTKFKKIDKKVVNGVTYIKWRVI